MPDKPPDAAEEPEQDTLPPEEFVVPQAEPAPEPEPEQAPPLQVVYVPVQYTGMPDPETLEGRIWRRGRSQWMPEGMAKRLTLQDSRFRILNFPAPRTSDGGPLLRQP